MKTVVVFALLCASAARVGAEVPVTHSTAVPGVSVSRIDDKSIELDDRTQVVLDGAFRFDASAADVNGEYADWSADFVVSFNSNVNARSVALYGQFGSYDWMQVTPPIDIAKDEEVRLLEQVTGFPLAFRDVITFVETFNCGVKDVSGLNGGAVMKVVLRLFETDDNGEETGRILDVVVCDQQFGERSDVWFDANIGLYDLWPEDARLSYGAYWTAGLLELDVVAAVNGGAELEIVGGAPLCLVAKNRKLITERTEIKLVSEILFRERDVANLPPVDQGWKGAVVMCSDASGLVYYGIAKVGSRNEWARLNGPVPKNDGKMSKVELTLQKSSAGAVLRYRIDGEMYSVGGSTSIPVVLSDSTALRVSFQGQGSIGSLSACVMRQSGTVMLLR